MSIAIIRSTITTALVAWADTKDIPVVRESQHFDKPADNGTYIEIYIIPAETFCSTLDGTGKRYRGEVLCNIWVKDGEGAGEAEELAEEIAALFPVVPKSIYLPVSVEQPPSVKKSILDDSGYRITPVCFPYRAEF